MRYVKVARLADVPEDRALRVDLEGRPVALVRVGERIHAVDDTCTHEKASLSDGWVEDTEIECPHHGACFDVVTGEAVTLPATEPLRTHDVRIVGEDVLVMAVEEEKETRDVQRAASD